jgi:hypothetical protein
VVVATQLGHRETALELARPVSVGQHLSARDVREISISTDTDLAVIRASAKAVVMGRPVAYTLPAGALLTKDLVGAARVPPAGQAVAALGLKAGQVPPGLQPGNEVSVVAAPSSDAETGAPPASPSAWEGTVLEVRQDSTDQTTVVSVQMAQTDARLLAAAPSGQVGLVIVHGGGR